MKEFIEHGLMIVISTVCHKGNLTLLKRLSNLWNSPISTEYYFKIDESTLITVKNTAATPARKFITKLMGTRGQKLMCLLHRVQTTYHARNSILMTFQDLAPSPIEDEIRAASFGSYPAI